MPLIGLRPADIVLADTDVAKKQTVAIGPVTVALRRGPIVVVDRLPIADGPQAPGSTVVAVDPSRVILRPALIGMGDVSAPPPPPTPGTGVRWVDTNRFDDARRYLE
jgi:hypothetical protein